MIQDFELDPNGDLLIENGDFAIEESDQQHIEDIIQAFPGWWKEFPQLGVGIFSYLKSGSDFQALEQTIKSQLVGDGYNVNNPRVALEQGQLTVEPNAIRQLNSVS